MIINLGGNYTKAGCYFIIKGGGIIFFVLNDIEHQISVGSKYGTFLNISLLEQ